MQIFRSQILLTLVLLSFSAQVANSKPHGQAPANLNLEKQSTVAPADPDTLENLAITPPPKVNSNENDLLKKFVRSTYFYPFRRSLSVYLGTVFGFKDSTDHDNFMNYVGGFKYLLPTRSSMRWELGADLLTLGNGHISVSRRRIYSETSAFRPYYRYGITHKFVPDERFASFSNYDNYLAAFAVGFEDIRASAKSIRLEIEFLAGTEDLLGLFTIGYSWAW